VPFEGVIHDSNPCTVAIRPEQSFSASKGRGKQPTRCWKAKKPYDESRYQRTFCGGGRCLMPKTGVFLLTQVTPGSRPHSLITFAFPQSGILWRKILALVVRPLVNLSKDSPAPFSDFFLCGANLSRALIGEKRRIVVLSPARFGFWPLISVSELFMTERSGPTQLGGERL